MNFLNCTNISLLENMAKIRNWIELLFIAIPIILLMILLIKLLKIINDKENYDIKKICKEYLKKGLIYCSLFLVPIMVQIIMMILGSTLIDDASCYKYATKEQIEKIKQENNEQGSEENQNNQVEDGGEGNQNNDEEQDNKGDKNQISKLKEIEKIVYNEKEWTTEKLNELTNKVNSLEKSKEKDYYNYVIETLTDRINYSTSNDGSNGSENDGNNSQTDSENNGSNDFIDEEIEPDEGSYNIKDPVLPPVTSGTKKIIFVGDSRTEGMCLFRNGAYDHKIFNESANNSTTYDTIKLNSNEECLYRGGHGLSWLKTAALPVLDQKLSKDNYIVIINLGTNNLYNISANATSYANIYNTLAANYPNSKIIATSVTQINDELAAKYNYTVTNNLVIEFNSVLKSKLNSNVKYCNIYSSLEGNYSTFDGIHYQISTYDRIYNLLKQCAQ